MTDDAVVVSDEPPADTTLEALAAVVVNGRSSRPPCAVEWRRLSAVLLCDALYVWEPEQAVLEWVGEPVPPTARYKKD